MAFSIQAQEKPQTYEVTGISYYLSENGQYYQWDESVSPIEDIVSICHNPINKTWELTYMLGEHKDKVKYSYSIKEYVNIYEVLGDNKINSSPVLKFTLSLKSWIKITPDKGTIYVFLSEDVGDVMVKLSVHEVPSGQNYSGKPK